MKTFFPMRTFLFSILICSGAVAIAQNQTYQSTVDQGLSLQKIIVVPMTDNVGNIYGKPLTETILETLAEDRRYKAEVLRTSTDKPEAFEEKVAEAQKVLKAQKADGLLISRLVRGPKGISVRLSLIGGADGLPLVQEKLEDFTGFETQDLQRQVGTMVRSLLQRLPYQAVVTSRRGQMITLNAGARHGLKVGDEIYVILISKVERHPQFHFLTRVDREIMGKIKIGKVDDSISFGSLIAERTPQLVQPGHKVSWSEMITYPAAGLAQDGTFLPQISEKAEAATVYGESPREWTTDPSASFGKISLVAGISQAKLSTAWASGESPSSSNSMSPTIQLEGEMWLDPRWQFNLSLEQMATKLNNDRVGSSPGSLNVQLQDVTLLAAYNVQMDPTHFWGPKFHIFAGLSKLSIFVDDSNPRTFTSKDYGGMALGLGGSFPLSSDSSTRILAGGRILYFLTPSLGESPSSSGSAKNQLVHFNVFMEYGLTPKLSFRTDLTVKQGASTFTGGDANSASADFIGLLGGATFYF